MGAASDSTIPFQSGLLQDFQENEAVLGDIYRGDQYIFFSPFSGHLFHLSHAIQ
jgi:hypothetical protein